jgi:maleate cis-trans isomerase
VGLGVAGTMDLAAVRRIGVQVTKDTPGADGIWMTGALMPSVSTIEGLERETRLPVIASVQVMAWQALRLAGVTGQIDGFGRLLREL